MGRSQHILDRPGRPTRAAEMVKKKFMSQADMKIGAIGDEDTITGMILAGVGHVDGQGKKNFLIVDAKTNQREVEDTFLEMLRRKDIAMILITQGCADGAAGLM